MYKVVNYRRALWLNTGAPTLESLIKLALGECPDVPTSKFEYRSDTSAQVSERDQAGKGTAIYLTMYTEGRRAATIQNGGPKVKRQKAPSGEEYLRTGIHMVVEGNHVGFLAEGHTNDGQLTLLCQKLIEHAGRPIEETQFALHPRADRDQIQSLLKAGVKSIDLGISAFKSTINELNDEIEGSIPAALWAFISSVSKIGSEKMTAEQMMAASEIQARVHLGYDGRTAGALVPKLLADIASGVAEADDEFKIITNDDVTITRTKLIIRREVSVDGDDLAIETTSSFAAIRETMKQWRNAGIFEN